jgi:hypothetical protein
MKRSEKILLGVLALVCLVAGWMVFFESPKAAETVASMNQGFTEFVTQLRVKILGSSPDAATARSLELLAEGREKSPFYAQTKSFYFESDGLGEVVDTDYVYSGYLRFGRQAMAIINNLEYAAGDELADGSFRVASIARESVSLERTDPNTGRVVKRQIPIIEDDMEQITLRRAN